MSQTGGIVQGSGFSVRGGKRFPCRRAGPAVRGCPGLGGAGCRGTTCVHAGAPRVCMHTRVWQPGSVASSFAGRSGVRGQIEAPTGREGGRGWGWGANSWGSNAGTWGWPEGASGIWSPESTAGSQRERRRACVLPFCFDTVASRPTALPRAGSAAPGRSRGAAAATPRDCTGHCPWGGAAPAPAPGWALGWRCRVRPWGAPCCMCRPEAGPGKVVQAPVGHRCLGYCCVGRRTGASAASWSSPATCRTDRLLPPITRQLRALQAEPALLARGWVLPGVRAGLERDPVQPALPAWTPRGELFPGLSPVPGWGDLPPEDRHLPGL